MQTPVSCLSPQPVPRFWSSRPFLLCRIAKVGLAPWPSGLPAKAAVPAVPSAVGAHHGCRCHHSTRSCHAVLCPAPSPHRRSAGPHARAEDEPFPLPWLQRWGQRMPPSRKQAQFGGQTILNLWRQIFQRRVLPVSGAWQIALYQGPGSHRPARMALWLVLPARQRLWTVRLVTWRCDFARLPLSGCPHCLR